MYYCIEFLNVQFSGAASCQENLSGAVTVGVWLAGLAGPHRLTTRPHGNQQKGRGDSDCWETELLVQCTLSMQGLSGVCLKLKFRDRFGKGFYPEVLGAPGTGSKKIVIARCWVNVRRTNQCMSCCPLSPLFVVCAAPLWEFDAFRKMDWQIARVVLYNSGLAL